MDKRVFILIILALLMVNIASAKPIFQTSSSNGGLTLQSADFDVYKQNSKTFFNIHVYNSSNGVLMSNISKCVFHLYRSDYGDHIFEGNFTLDSNNIDQVIMVNSSLFNETGYYDVTNQCTTTSGTPLGGSLVLSFIITPSGYQATSSEMTFYIFSLSIILILFIASLIGIFNIDDKDTYDITGTKLLRMKSGVIIKLFLIMLSIFLFWVITFILWQISYNSLMLVFITNILRLFFIWYTILMIPIIIMLLGLIFVRFVTQIKFTKDSKRGIT